MTLALDGDVDSSFSKNDSSKQVSLTTAQDNDVIIVVVGLSSSSLVTVSSISSSPSLTWTKRKSVVAPNGTREVEEWYAVWNSHGSITITVNFSGTATDFDWVIAFGISGADTVNIFDPNAGLPVTKSDYDSSVSVSISTSNANDFIIGMVAVGSTVTGIQSGFTTLTNGLPNSYRGVEYKIVSSIQSGLSVGFTFSSSANYAFIADAIMAPTYLNVSDSGAGSDVPSMQATLPSSDAGNGTEALDMQAQLSLSDVSVGVDSIVASCSLTVSDSGAGIDAVFELQAQLTLADLGVGYEGFQLEGSFTVSDSGLGTEFVYAGPFKVAKLFFDFGGGLVIQLSGD